MKKTGTIRLWLRTDKVNKGGTKRAAAGTMPIFIIYSLKGKRQFLNTGINIYAEQWDGDNENIKALAPTYAKKYGLRIVDLPTLQDAKKQVQEIERLKIIISKVEQEYNLNEVAFTSQMVMAEVKERLNPVAEKSDTQNSVLAFMQDWIKRNEAIQKKGSMQVYRTVTQRLFEYEQANNTKLLFENTNYSFFEDFKAFLNKEYDLNSITIAKQLNTLKTFLNKAQKQEIPVNTNFKAFKIERENDLEVIALTQKEFNTLWELDLKDKPRLDAIRDVFLFSCSTGMRYSDLAQLRRHQIKGNAITQTVTKTSAKIKIPLNKYSRAILAKYADAPQPLPIISNQKSNDALHDLCKEAEINEPTEIVRKVNNEVVKTIYPKHELITMHSGRKSFATLSLKKGMSIQNVMKIGGWRDFKSFARYVNVTNEDAQEAMNECWG